MSGTGGDVDACLCCALLLGLPSAHHGHDSPIRVEFDVTQ